MKTVSDIFKSIKFASIDPKRQGEGHKGGSQDDEEHYTVGEKEYAEQLKHVKKRAGQEVKEEWSKTGKEATHRETGEKTYEYHEVDKEGKPTGKREYRNAQGKSMGESVEQLEEKNVPTSPEKWAQAKAQAKAKFDVYPSAYANGWAAKKYKEMGGGWKSVSEAVKDEFDVGEYDQEGDMAKSDLRSIIANAKKLHDMMEDSDNLPEWVQSKITKAEDYISTVANYMTAEMNEESENLDEGMMKRMATDKEEDARLSKPPFDKPYTTTKGTVTDKSGAKHGPMSRARDLARAAARKQAGIKEETKDKKETEYQKAYKEARKSGSSVANARARAAGADNKHVFESRQLEIVKEAMKTAKKKKETKTSDDTFQAEPELTSQIVKTN